MKKLPFDLTSLIPREATFTVSGKTLTLCRWSLRVRNWATNKYGHQGLAEIFEQQKIQEIADMAWFMLKEKDQFPGASGMDDFLDLVSSIEDQVNLIKALLSSVGIGEPEIKKISDGIKAAGGKPDGAADPNG